MLSNPSLDGEKKIIVTTVAFILVGSALLMDAYSDFLNIFTWTWTLLSGSILVTIGVVLGLLAYSVHNSGPIADRIFGRYYHTRWRLAQIYVERKILLYGGGILFLFGAVSHLVFPSFLINSLENPGTIITTNTQILATVFAITISLTLLGLEHYSQRLTPRIARSVLYSKFIVLLLASYTLSIAANIFVLSFLEEFTGRFVFYSFVTLVWCLLYLVAYLFYIIRKLQPDTQLEMLKESIPNNFAHEIVQKHREGIIRGTDERDRFVDIQKVIIRTVRDNDIYLFAEWSGLLFSKELEFLEEIRRRQEEDDPTLSDDEADAISGYFLHLERQIYTEILKTENAQFLNSYISNLGDVLDLLIDMRETGILDAVTDHFNQIGRDIIEKEYESVFRTYNDALENITKAEYESLPSSEHHSVFQDEIERIDDLSEEDQEKRLWAMSGRMTFAYDRLTFFEEYCTAAVDKGYDKPVTSVLSTCSDLVGKSVAIENEQYQGFLLRNILSTQKTIYDYAMEEGVEVSFMGLGGMGRMISSLSPDDVEDVGMFLTIHYCDSAVTAVENDVFSGFHELGVLGRSVVEDYPDLALQVVDALRDSLEIVSESSNHENITREMVIEQLDSIQGWSDHDHENVDEKIGDIYEEFDIDVDDVLD
ncbi:DUF2254 family protein [Halorubrum sp. CSM-61]|uniref:DUF2254 family protein n=1 Tax=Halorubrum sp. CSM-61 TaxID=2485838 RepID=UPI000F4B0EA9|nr:DUF2254 family protein [Halorubrum sp. CSM-61]